VESLPEKPTVGMKFRGLASFYADKYHGRKTSSGEIFDMYGLTCAHNTLAFNTWLEVRNLANNRTVIVRVNDRGPFIEGRILDLSYGAAKEIGMLLTGIQEVECTVIK
jgi:rare lipoprotein A